MHRYGVVLFGGVGWQHWHDAATLLSHANTSCCLPCTNLHCLHTQRIGTNPQRCPEGRFLTEEDLTPALINRRAEVGWCRGMMQ